MPSIRELQPLVSQPMEELGVEHKGWIDLTSKEHKATLAKAAIALANHGGGFIVIGMADQGDRLQSQPPPSGLLSLTQDDVNSAISRHADPAFHCQMHLVEHPCTNIKHPVIVVPGDLTVPVMAKRNVEGVIARSCPGIPDLDRCRQQRVLECPYGARDGSRIGRRQLGNDHARDAIGGRSDPICGLYWEISPHLSCRSFRETSNR